MIDHQLYRLFFEHSIDPFILFDSEGNVLEYNDEGEYILSKIDKSELFNLAVSHASMTFGFKQTLLELTIGHSTFCALNVGYINSDVIGLVLHKSLCNKRYKNLSHNLQPANIFTLVDIAINTNLGDETKILREYDASIPEFKININRFLQFLNKIFKQLRGLPQIKIVIKMATGETMLIEKRRYQIVAIDIVADREIELGEEEFIYSPRKEGGVHIELPFIL
ncbi:MAG: hypothetical protein C6I00_07645 [Nitratiruptor sp.]|nr:hypothetical protein [Nitratiruptor sp.]NPA82964.1 hypothetical protein [Campylobacterota bacterium]